MSMTDEIEVFRIKPKVRKCYKHAESTRMIWNEYPEPNKYYTTNTPRFVGRFIRMEDEGTPGSTVKGEFKDDSTGEKNTVVFSDDTCFIEVPCGTADSKCNIMGGKKKRKSLKKKRKSKRRKSFKKKQRKTKRKSRR
tara:strand:+ start:84 stop:494 length:411 start_codon:yes stop_codon:yes gene_type:complete